MRILVAGRNGQLARALAATDAGGRLPVPTCLGRPELDITDRRSVRRAIAEYRPDLVVNAAAYTAVDKAESEPDAAFAVNRTGAENLALGAADAGIPIIHVSTDYVFSGDSERPYVETDPTCPINIYGESKLAGEQAVAAANPHHIILRTCWVYSPWGSNFLKTMLRLGSEREELRIVADQTGTPTGASDIASAILPMAGAIAVGSGASDKWGIYHLANSGVTTWHDFAAEIFRIASEAGHRVPRLARITSEEFPTPARRPRYSVLDTGKIKAAFGIQLRDWRAAVGECVRQLV